MGLGFIHNLIKNEYEKRRRIAFDINEARKNEVYSKIPRIMEIDSQMRLLGIKYNKMILNGAKPADKAVNELTSKLNALKDEKTRLLVKEGYSPDFMDIVYQCQACKDTGFVENGKELEKCTCYKQQLINYLYSQANLSLIHKENFSTFDESLYPDVVDENRYGIKKSPRENILGIKEKCLRFIENFDSPEENNLFFCGPAGVGKTFMVNCIAAEILKKGRTVLYQTAPVLFYTINEYKNKAFKEYEDYEDTGYKNIFDVDLLIIDDLGTESQSSARYAELLNILNTRYMKNLLKPCKTIISTNIEVEKLYEYYTERVASRIIGCFALYRFAGEDIRRLKKALARG